MVEARERGEQEVPRRVTWDTVMAALALLSLIPVMWVELAGLRFGDPRFQLLAALDLVLVIVFAAD